MNQHPILDPGQVLRDAWAVYREHAPVLLPAALVVLLVQTIVAFAARDSTPVIGALVAIVAGVLFQGMVVRLAQQAREGRVDEASGRLFVAVGPVFLPLLAVAILAGAAIAAGIVLLVIPGLVVATFLSVAAPVVVLEQPRPLWALGRSGRLVRGNAWPTFALILLLLVLQAVVVGLALGLGLGDLGSSVLELVLGTLVAPFQALVTASLYFRLRELEDVRTDPAEPAESIDDVLRR